MGIVEVCGIIAGVGAAIAAVNNWIIKPIKQISSKMDKIEDIENGQKVLMKAQAQTMEHLISGNNIEELRKEYQNLIDYCINQ